MIRFLPVCTLLALFASVTVQAQEATVPEPDPEWDMIRLEVKSWGAPVREWQFGKEYGGYWGENVSQGGAYAPTYTLAYHTLEQDTARYQALADIVSRLPEPAPNSEGCENFMTDQAYGVIRLTLGATTTEIAWNSGCQDEDYAVFMALLREADELVSGWGRAEPVNRTEDFSR